MRNVAAILLLLLVLSAAAQTSPKSVKTLRVEAVAGSADLSEGDVARALLAVRDGKAQPMQ